MSRASRRTSPGQRRVGRVWVVAWAATLTLTALPSVAGAATGVPSLPRTTGANLTAAVAYLVDPTRLISGHYYEAFAGSGFADYSLTLDGAFALAATGSDPGALARLGDFIATRGTDATGRTVDAWTGIGTPYASGGSIAKELLLAEVLGADPRSFGGHDLVAAAGAAVCTQVSLAPDASCPAVGAYRYSPSVFSQGLGIISELRAGSAAASPVAYLEGLQHPDGSWPSLIPSTGDSDVDSTAMAVMALAMVPGAHSAAAAARGQAWIAAQQEADGGFPGAAGDSTNSAALAVQALNLTAATFAGPLARAQTFLAARQNADGGFTVSAGGQPGSDLRASTQAVNGVVGISFGALAVTGGSPSPSTSPSTTATATATASASPSGTVSTSASASASTSRSGPSSVPASASLSVEGTATTTDPSLPATGAHVGGTALVGVLLLAGGLALVLAGRRSTSMRRH